MKLLFGLGLLLICSLLFGVSAFAQANPDITLHKSCSLCGMSRDAFSFSRMVIEYDDGTVVAACSLHCAALDLANNIDKTPKSIKVADFNGKQLIDAESAFWVIGGKRPGVMSKRGKWAFEKKEGAEGFIKSNGGALAGFEEAIKAAYEDMYEDTKMIRDKRKMMRSNKMGHKS